MKTFAVHSSAKEKHFMMNNFCALFGLVFYFSFIATLHSFLGVKFSRRELLSFHGVNFSQRVFFTPRLIHGVIDFTVT